MHLVISEVYMFHLKWQLMLFIVDQKYILVELSAVSVN